mmetsp:Transcript_73230/g.210335  ORF Transcript_73230/g.210335 Transcript_73230/m.210335 type:complete len:271 (-) Transcript_73230:103-915(-)
MPAAMRRSRTGPLYVVEHMEEGLGEWCRLEYIHMCEIVPPERLLFLRWPEGVEPAGLSTAAGSSGPPLVTPQGLQELRSMLPGEPGYEAAASSATPPLRALPSWDRICLLDMDAEDALEPHDVTKFDALVFGGILGNVHELGEGKYGSDDRTAELRDLNFVHRRHLGPMQMTTDTAVLVCHMVLEEARCLAEIPFLDSPEIGESVAGESAARDQGSQEEAQGGETAEVCMEGFRYVARRSAGGGDWEPALPKGMRELLIRDLDNDILGQL